MGKYECDDGNTENGDGCSSTCKIEPGWECTGKTPDICRDTVLPRYRIITFNQSRTIYIIFSKLVKVVINETLEKYININATAPYLTGPCPFIIAPNQYVVPFKCLTRIKVEVMPGCTLNGSEVID